MADEKILKQELGEKLEWNKARVAFLVRKQRSCVEKEKTNKRAIKSPQVFRFKNLRFYLSFFFQANSFGTALAKFIIALIQVRTVNFSEIACVLMGRAKVESNYKRIIRFFRYFEICYKTVAKMIAKLVDQEAPWVIVMDRTEWKYGKSWINILVLSIAYKGVNFPICWKILNKKGNSNTEERKDLINEFISIFGVKSIKFLLADREFLSTGQKIIKVFIGNIYRNLHSFG